MMGPGFESHPPRRAFTISCCQFPYLETDQNTISGLPLKNSMNSVSLGEVFLFVCLSIVGLHCCPLCQFLLVQQSESSMCIHVLPLFRISFPLKSPHSIKQSSLGSPAGSHHLFCTRAACSVALSDPTLRDPTDCSPPDSSIHGVLQARILEWAAMSSSRGSSQPRDRTWASCVSWVGRCILSHCAVWKALFYT